LNPWQITYAHFSHLFDDPFVHDVSSGYSNFSWLLRLIACFRLIILLDRNNPGIILGLGSSGERNASANGSVSIENLENGAFLQRSYHPRLWLELSHLPPSQNLAQRDREVQSAAAEGQEMFIGSQVPVRKVVFHLQISD
jgi:hypothetical protein